MQMGDTCFLEVVTTCGHLELTINALKKRYYGGRDDVVIEFTDFSQSSVMLGYEHTPATFGGAPGLDKPYRQEHFIYPHNEDVTEQERMIKQGRINPDTLTYGPKYWGSLLQG